MSWKPRCTCGHGLIDHADLYDHPPEGACLADDCACAMFQCRVEDQERLEREGLSVPLTILHLKGLTGDD